MIIKEYTGIGYARKFLNGISVFIDGQEIGRLDCHCCFYSMAQIKDTIGIMLFKHLIQEFVNQGIDVGIVIQNSMTD